MRNLVIAFLMLLLPLQWGTTVLAAYFAHQQTSAVMQHFGHHTHDHEHFGSGQHSNGEGKVCDASCIADHDHSHHTHAIFAAPRLTAVFAAGPDDSPYGTFVPDPPCDNLLRPPQRALA